MFLKLLVFQNTDKLPPVKFLLLLSIYLYIINNYYCIIINKYYNKYIASGNICHAKIHAPEAIGSEEDEEDDLYICLCISLV